ncbi:MAG: cytochrome c-550 PedF [Neomegalonema sp.]|nr:cytochrome c-550 PedF [Neomegalonema sp.]
MRFSFVEVSSTLAALGVAALLVAQPQIASAHGDVAPQPVDTDALPDVGEEWLTENPYRSVDREVFLKAIEIGASGYNQNCARCHGLEVVSGGLAPDLRYLEAEEYGDEWFLERFREGYTQNGITKMPAFGELLGQKAAWAIRTYVETRPDDGALDPFAEELGQFRDRLAEIGTGLGDGSLSYDSVAEEIAAITGKLEEIAAQVETGSGQEYADTAASRAAALLSKGADGVVKAQEALKIGLSDAQ